MPLLPQVRINGRAFIVDKRLREIRNALNSYEIYKLDQDVIPPEDAPLHRLPESHEPQSSALSAFITNLPEHDRDIPHEHPKPPFKSVLQPDVAVPDDAPEDDGDWPWPTPF